MTMHFMDILGFVSKMGDTFFGYGLSKKGPKQGMMGEEAMVARFGPADVRRRELDTFMKTE